MSVYEKARIKLLDKNTGAVLKEVDPFTSAEAVTCDDTETVQQKIDEFTLSITTNKTNISNIVSKHETDMAAVNKKNLDQDNSITIIQNKNSDQDTKITLLQQNIATHETDISNLKAKNTSQDTLITSLDNKVSTQNTLISTMQTKNTDQDNLISTIQASSIDQNTKITAMQNTLTTMQNGSPSKVFVRTTDPGSAAAVYDTWVDLTNNVLKYKTSTGTWKIVGAAYN